MNMKRGIMAGLAASCAYPGAASARLKPAGRGLGPAVWTRDPLFLKNVLF